jgi:hypothetical protein
VDAVEGLDVGLGQPVHRLVEALHDVVEVERAVADGAVTGETCLPVTSSRPPLIA